MLTDDACMYFMYLHVCSYVTVRMSYMPLWILDAVCSSVLDFLLICFGSLHAPIQRLIMQHTSLSLHMAVLQCTH
jgi:hypothetical protein